MCVCVRVHTRAEECCCLLSEEHRGSSDCLNTRLFAKRMCVCVSKRGCLKCVCVFVRARACVCVWGGLVCKQKGKCSMSSSYGKRVRGALCVVCILPML